MKSTHSIQRAGVFAALMMAVGQAAALGVGEIERQSSLGQPLDLLIPLSAENTDALDGLAARIARDEFYQANGLSRLPVLDRASVRIVQIGGQPYVQIQTRDPVREPILDLVLEVVGLNGTTLRRVYGVLLDPPDPNAAVATASPTRSRRTAPALKDAAPSASTSALAAAAPATVAATPQDRAASSPHRHRHLAASHRSRPTPTVLAADPNITPVLYPPSLRMAEQLEHPPFLAGAPVLTPSTSLTLAVPLPTLAAPSASMSAAQPAPVPAPRSAPTQPLAVTTQSTTVAADKTSSGLLWLLLGLSGVIAFAASRFWQRRQSAQSAAETKLAKTIREFREQAAAELAKGGPAPVAASEVLPATVEPVPAVYVAPPREVQVQAGAPLEEHPDQALNFYQDVANLLQTELAKDPARRDLRYKLLEVYYAANLKEQFREQTRFYLEQLQGRIDDNWPEIVRMGRHLIPDSGLYSDHPPVMSRTVVQTLPVIPVAKAQTFQRFYEAVNQAKLSGRQAELEKAWDTHVRDPAFQRTFAELIHKMLNRPTLLTRADALSGDFGGAALFRKFEDQRGHDDIPLINAVGQVLLASRMGKKRVVAATRGGVHGGAVAKAARELRLGCDIYMMDSDQRQNPERLRVMQDCGANVMSVHTSAFAATDDVRIRALEEWMQDGETTLYINSVDAGPYPYPTIVLHFQGVVGREVRAQTMQILRKSPDAIVVGTGDGLSAIGLLQGYIADKNVALYCVETSLPAGTDKKRHRFGREHSWMRVSGRVSYVTVAEADARRAIEQAQRLERWSLDLPAGEVLAQAHTLATSMDASKSILLMLPKPEEVRAVMATRAAG